MRQITTKKLFQAWLKQQPPGSTFERCNSHACPLAIYSGLPVGCGRYGKGHELPKWARQYTYRFDNGGASTTGGRETVGLREAVRALRGSPYD
jgi:hypothetical protein